MTGPCDGPFRVRVLVPAEPAIVRVPVPAEPAVIHRVERGDIGPQGAPGLAGAPGDAPTPYPLAGVASFVARHGFPFMPTAWIVTVAGEVVEADVFHAPGMTTVMFPGPFTGTLYLR